MKLFPKVKIPKINWSNVAETSLAIGIVGAVAVGGFVIAQHWLGFFSYQGMNRSQVLETRNKVEQRLPILSRACGTDLFGKSFCRGIYLPPNGSMLYYRFEDDGVKNASYNLYSVPSELWTTTPSLLPQRFIGKLVS